MADDSSTPVTAPAPSSDTSTPDPVPTDLFSVHRSQDGAQVRAELSLTDAQSECNILNAQARMNVGQTVDGIALYGSMYHGEISRYEVRSASGLVV
jgi:hypothetical protein